MGHGLEAKRAYVKGHDDLDDRVKAVLERHEVTSLLRSLKLAELDLLLQIMRSRVPISKDRTLLPAIKDQA